MLGRTLTLAGYEVRLARTEADPLAQLPGGGAQMTIDFGPAKAIASELVG